MAIDTYLIRPAGALRGASSLRLLARAAYGLTVLLALSACEAPLRLDGVQARLQDPIRRFDLFQAAADNGSAILVVGGHGLAIRSTDAGASWERNVLPDWPELIDVTACADGTFAALAIEGQVWISTDSGVSWTARPFETEESAQAVTCDPGNRIWVVGSFSTILMSADAGQTWEDRSLGDDVIFNNIQFLDADHGIVLGEFGALLKSSDGGETWEQADPIPDEFYPQDAWFRDADTGWVVGLGGQVLATRDGGATWAAQPSPTVAPLYTLRNVGDTLYATGGEGTLLRLDGEQWVRVEHGKPIRLFLRVLLPVGGDKLLVAGTAGALYVLPIADLTVALAR
ncbi:MAG: hypothetical protein IT495_07925 [Gammaproteobacteria bacterium]|nr:hypothetical protein [Gammaproteobacteria bacterium]